jgi:hypothetical protein
LERAKIGELLLALKFFGYFSKLYLGLIKPPFFDQINRNCLKYVETLWALGQGGFLVSYWLETRKEMHPSCLHFSVSIAEKVFNPLWAFPKESPIPFRFCSNGLQELIGSFPNVSSHRFGHFLNISLKAACLCSLRLQIRDKTKKILNHQRIFSQSDLSNNSTYSQSQKVVVEDIPRISSVYIY